MRRACLILLPLCLLACGNQESRDGALRDSVARQFGADCQRARAPDAEQARVLQQLCSCSVARIRTGDIAFGDTDDVISAKVQRVQAACLREVYGDEPGATNASR